MGLKNLCNHITQSLVTIFMLGGILLVAPNPVHAQIESFDFILDLTGPTYVQAGNELTYELKLQNTSNQAYTNLELFNDLSEDVTYVSGGEFIEDNVDYVYFEIPNLAPGATRTLSWVARANSNLTVGTVITNDSFGFLDVPAGATVGNNPGATTLVEASGTLESVYRNADGVAFNVTVDSFSFPNFTHTSPSANRDFRNDLLPEDLFRYFGPAVCHSGNTAETCELTGPAQQWLTHQIADMDLGVCEGMAATSLHLFNGQEFKDYNSPASIQPGAQTAVDLDFPGSIIENYVSYYYNTQYADEVYESQIYGSANETIATLKAGFDATPSIPYTLAIFLIDDQGHLAGGHAITPYGIERVSNSESRILVYDNNFPKQRQYITVNTVANSWRYVTTATPGQGDSVYEGVGNNNELALTPNNIRNNASGEYFTCPFCEGGAISKNAGSQEPERIIFSYAGEGAYVVIDDNGRSTGFETDTGDFVDEIPGAEVAFHRGGLGLNVPPKIRIPFDGPDDTFYSVFVHAQTEGDVTDGDLHITGPGFSVGVNNISLDPFEAFEFSISPDGDHISFIATEDIEAPELVIAHDPISPGTPSVIFDIEGILLRAGEKVMLDLDPVLEQIHFSHTGPEAENIVIDMRLISPNGDVEDYTETLNLPAGVQTGFVDFGAWDGQQRPLISIGSGGNIAQIPTLSQWAMTLTMLMLVLGAFVMLRRRV